MLKPKVHNLLNEQYNREIVSSNRYLTGSSWCEEKGYLGFSKFLKKHSEEEMEHSEKIRTFLLDNGNHVIINNLEKEPKRDFKSIMELMKYNLNLEKFTTNLINSIYDVALQEKEYSTVALLNWFVTEQVEEEKTFQDIINDLELVGNDHIYLIDCKFRG